MVMVAVALSLSLVGGLALMSGAPRRVTRAARRSTLTMAARVEEQAFLEACTLPPNATVDCIVDCFHKWGVVRLPRAVDPKVATALLEEAEDVGLRRNAFGQPSQADRLTLWLCGDDHARAGWQGEAPMDDGTVATRRELSLHGAIYGELLAVPWLEACERLGARHLALAEAVVSFPGGAAQEWHYDGGGVTLQLALSDVQAVNGPTELTPRALSPGYVAMMMQPDELARRAWETVREAPLQLPARAARAWLTAIDRPLYDAVTGAHALAWAVLRPHVTRQRATQLLERGLLPPVVHLTAEVGLLTAYDAAMIHRGGRNGGDAPRPILAIHMRDEATRRAARAHRARLGSGAGSAGTGRGPSTYS